tara:strand:- start:1347 stop:1811 length:465 start_codon:yes stop_codon:yes gene_type:complete
MNLSEHFTLKELTRSQLADRRGIQNVPGERSVESLKVLCSSILEPVRVHFNTPFSPNSGYRSFELNDLLGSSRKSQHCVGEAADIEVPGVSNVLLAWWIRSHLDFDQLILEYYTKGDPVSGWVHVSNKEASASSSNRREVLTYDGNGYVVGLPE